ncbi:hypothetical protein [Litorihabitans aurantiacus]|uniref:hypothetical protein n=1 Tax=Litorihabitans aurantiacus TaxID=1930061 RepID=UPI0024E06DA6|nr:hypothetical protein [Litorihabitans aurantiacus]
MTRQAVTDAQAESAALLARAQQEASDLVKNAELADVRAYDAAVNAGWSQAELRKIGLPPAAKTTRVARRRRTAAAPTPDPVPQSAEQELQQHEGHPS